MVMTALLQQMGELTHWLPMTPRPASGGFAHRRHHPMAFGLRKDGQLRIAYLEIRTGTRAAAINQSDDFAEGMVEGMLTRCCQSSRIRFSDSTRKC